MFRTAIFWMHLCSGVAVGLVVLMMSVTGVILTYERQMLSWDIRELRAVPAEGQQRLPIETLARAVADNGGFEPSAIVIDADPAVPAMARKGRGQLAYLNPYTAEIYPPRESGLDSFFSTVTRIHRWFNVSGDGRDTARQVTGISNLVFLFLIVSGLYLWLPKIYRWGAFRLRLWFHKASNSAARDYNWHHVLGIWMAIPLIVIVATGAVFNYSWANSLVYRMVGEEPPVRGRRGPGVEEPGEPAPPIANPAPLDRLLDNAAAQVEDWRTLSITLPAAGDEQASVSIDQGTGGQPQKRHTVKLDTRSGEVVAFEPFSSLPARRQARSWVRFLHTGEAFGLLGQTIAGLASAAAVLMVWTGLALAWRRLQRSRAKSRRKQTLAMESAG